MTNEVKKYSGLSLSEAMAEGRLETFITDAEAYGVGPADEAEFNLALDAEIKRTRSADQTSRSSTHDGSLGK